MKEAVNFSTANTLPKANGHWLFKNGPAISKDILGFIQKNRPIYGDIYNANPTVMKACIITNPDYVKYVLQENNRNYTKSFGYEILRLFLGNGLLTSEGDFWRQQRRLAQPSFHKEKLTEITKSMTRASVSLAEKWTRAKQQGNPIDVGVEMNNVTLDIVASALFGTNVSEHMDRIREAITVANEFAIKRIMRLVRLPIWVPLPSHLSFQKAATQLDNIIYGIIEERKRDSSSHHDLLQMLMDARDEDTGEKMNTLQLRDEVMTIFLAGHETTANALTWCWYLLSKHPEIEHKLIQEYNTVLNGKAPEFSDLPKLTYTRQVIEETLRHYPPAWIVGRRPVKDDVIGGYKIEAGTNVLLCTYEIHHHPDYWENPNTFDPERFSSENKSKIHKYAYFPFGGGPRLCIGNNFAIMEAQIILATLLQKFKLRSLTNTEPDKDPLITLRPKKPIIMGFA